MKILWVSPFFLHPTERGAQIRSLGMLRELHKRHEIHFAALADPAHPEGPARSNEYCSRSYPVKHKTVSRASFAFLAEFASNLFSSTPLAIARYESAELAATVSGLWRSGSYDCLVSDFLTSACNTGAVESCIIFQHNVETTIWERHAQCASTPWLRMFFRTQANRMRAYEGLNCRQAAHVIAVSEEDARRMESDFGIPHVSTVATGVDIDYFTPATDAAGASGIVFTGSMDWLPNIDGIEWFVQEILPLIRKKIPNCELSIVGRNPDPKVLNLASRERNISVTGTVPDIRPYLWNSAISVVPLRIGGGTRLKIYESMAARTPVVSTTVGAEGLEYHPGLDIEIADQPELFAEHCIRLLEDEARRRALASEAWDLVNRRFSWAAISNDFEALLKLHAVPSPALAQSGRR
jgi:glycosyltransferase involved in cell wall biosynthesis